MSNILVAVDEQNLHIIEAPKIAAQGVKENYIICSFDSSWSGFGKTALFYRAENEGKLDQVYESPIDADGYALIPHEVTDQDGKICFCVVGVKDDIVYTTEILKYKIVKGLYTAGQETEPPTPGVYEQMLTIAGNMSKNVEEIRNDQDDFSTQINNQLSQFIAAHSGTVSGTKRTETVLWSGQAIIDGTLIELSDDVTNYDYIDVKYAFNGNRSLQRFSPSVVNSSGGAGFYSTNLNDGVESASTPINICEFHIRRQSGNIYIIDATRWTWNGASGSNSNQIIYDESDITSTNLGILAIYGIKYEQITASKDAELTDIRIGADGTIYQTAGAAVRAQIEELKALIDALSNN